MGFKLRSSGPFKMMGSSPVKQEDKNKEQKSEKVDDSFDKMVEHKALNRLADVSDEFNKSVTSEDDFQSTITKFQSTVMPSMIEEKKKAKDLGVNLDTTRYTIKENPNIELRMTGSAGDLVRANNPDPTTTSATITFDRPPMPVISLDPIKEELNTTPPEPVVKKAKLPPELRPEKKKVKKKRAKVKRVKRPKRTSTRNLVTGGKNRTRRSTGTSKRR
tara:strand:+ start:165 stop:818 length:654 start_codon:yes stop_codon:yes gene_type:complete